jgi:hypothetical protein
MEIQTRSVKAPRTRTRGADFLSGILVLALGALTVPAPAQQFVNLDFEQATLPDPWPPELFPSLPWEQAAPGWSHTTTGEATDPIIFGEGHIGQSQWYVLRDNQNIGSLVPPDGGAFSMGIGSGYSHSNPPHGEWIQAFLAQRGTVPEGTVELRLFSSGFEFQVQIDGVPITMVPIGLPSELRTIPALVASYAGPWSGDVSSFAGQVVELRIVNNVPEGRFSRIILDNIVLLPIPEPSTWILFAAGIGTLLLLKRRKPKER